MTKITVSANHRDSHAPHHTERERLAITLMSESHPDWAWRLVAEAKRMTFRAYADAVTAREQAERDALEAMVANTERTPRRPAIPRPQDDASGGPA